MSYNKTYRIKGRVLDKKTQSGIAGLLVKCWDADLLFDDLVGSAPTNADGSFFMEFDQSYFDELFLDRKPDLYFEIYYRGRCVLSTRGSKQTPLKSGEQTIDIEIDRKILEDDSGGKIPVYPDPRQFPNIPPDDPVNRGPRVRPIKPGSWQEEINKWWRERKKQRKEDGTLHIPKRPKPRPYLDCTSNFGPQIHATGINQPTQLTFPVWNDGNFPAWTCYVELYEGPWGYSHPLNDYELRGRTIISLRPGERREVAVPWERKMTSARIVGIVFDPLLDPKDFTLVEQVNRHITSVHYSS